LRTTLNKFAAPKPKSEEPFVPIDVVRVFYNKSLNVKRKRGRPPNDHSYKKKLRFCLRILSISCTIEIESSIIFKSEISKYNHVQIKPENQKAFSGSISIWL